MPDLDRIYLYRMTHIENVSHILECGVTHKNSPNANPNFITIGDTSLINTRSTKVVTVDNGDFLNFSAPTIILGDYIPFYFGIKMPMLYVMQNGGNFVRQATPPKDIVYLVCLVNRLIISNNNFYFSDGHATDHLTTFYDSSKIEELPTLIDWTAVKTAYWGGQENLNIKRKKQAEFLVENDIPVKYIVGFGCYNEVAEKRLITMGIKKEIIKIIPNAYF